MQIVDTDKLEKVTDAVMNVLDMFDLSKGDKLVVLTILDRFITSN